MFSMNVLFAPLTRPAGTLSPLGKLAWLGLSITGRGTFRCESFWSSGREGPITDITGHRALVVTSSSFFGRIMGIASWFSVVYRNSRQQEKRFHHGDPRRMSLVGSVDISHVSRIAKRAASSVPLPSVSIVMTICGSVRYQVVFSNLRRTASFCVVSETCRGPSLGNSTLRTEWPLIVLETCMSWMPTIIASKNFESLTDIVVEEIMSFRKEIA